jgi:clan AA aspartic protease
MGGDSPMIVGSVGPGGDAVVRVRVRGPRSTTVESQTVVDTGFNDWLTLSQADIEALALLFREEGRYTLADGSGTVSRLFAAEVEWFGRWRRILVVEMDGGPLLGMGMLRGFFLGVEVIDGGRVEIRPLDA